MNATEHIGQWQQAFLGVLAKNNVLPFALLFLVFAIVPFAKLFSQIKQTELAARLISYCKTAATKILNPLLLAFSDGILNPKIYEPAHI